MKWLLSSTVFTFSSVTGAKKLGHPQPASNLVSDSNSRVPQPMHRYVPGSSLLQYSPVNGRSVPFLRVTWYCSGVNCSRHSASVLLTLSTMGILHQMRRTTVGAT